MPMEASVGTRAKGECALNQGDCDRRSQEKAACQDLLRKENAQRLRFPRGVGTRGQGSGQGVQERSEGLSWTLGGTGNDSSEQPSSAQQPR